MGFPSRFRKSHVGHRIGTSLISSGFSWLFEPCWLDRLRFYHAYQIELIGLLMTGTMRFPSGNAAAIPKLMSLFLMMRSPSTCMFIIGKSRRAFGHGLHKDWCKGKLSPSCFSKASLTLLRQFQILVTSHSTKLCTWADVAIFRPCDGQWVCPYGSFRWFHHRHLQIRGLATCFSGLSSRPYPK